MKEFKEDKLELQNKIAELIREFNEKYGVRVDDVDLIYISLSGYVKVDIDIKI